MHVGIAGLNFAPEPTGIAPYTTRLAEGLAARGHSVSVLTTFPHYPQWTYGPTPPRTLREHRNGVSITRVRHYVPSRPGSINRALFEICHGLRVSATLRPSFDVLLLVSPALLASRLVLERARRLAVRPAVGLLMQDLYSHGLDETGTAGSAVRRTMRAIERSTAESVDGVAVIHDRFKKLLVEDFRVPERRVSVLRNWSHVAPTNDIDVPSVRRSFGWGEREHIVLHAGAMGVKQGLENVVQAAAVADQLHASIRFVMLGNGSRRDDLVRQAAGVKRIQFLDPLPDDQFRNALHAADVLLVNERPGIKEMAVPSKLTSYFAAGRPVLAAAGSDSTTAMEIDAAQAGVVIAPGVPRALVEGAMQLGADPAAAQRFGAAGRRYSKDVLSEESAIARYDGWVRQLLELSNERGRVKA